MQRNMRAIVWFRQDLRIADNAALLEACDQCDEVILVFIHDDNPQSISQLGSASNAWLHASLKSLSNDLLTKGSALVLKQGDSLAVLKELINETQATHLYWNRCYEPAIRMRDEIIKTHFNQSLTIKSFKGNLLFEPWGILKNDGTPFRVFTPYWNKLQIEEAHQSVPLPEPNNLKKMALSPDSLALDELGLLPRKPTPDWHMPMMAHWKVGESAALDTLENFLQTSAPEYKTKRDFPAIQATSTLSPHLHFGEISPMQIFYLTRSFTAENNLTNTGTTHFLREIAWREFAYSLLYHFPDTIDQSLNKKFKNFSWADLSKKKHQENLKLWQQGMTGYPIIDAGMRELWATGIMHNRVRMIVASFLTKNLLIHWLEGEAWFRDTLIDADIASNTMGWQWVAGSGADAAPYFRIFNPRLQSKKFDKVGEYIRRWIPELEPLDNKAIHEPSEQDAKNCGYPLPIVDLKATRERALARYAAARKNEEVLTEPNH